MLVFYHLFRFIVAPPLKPRWKAMFLCSAMVALSALGRVSRTDAPDAWVFLLLWTVTMIVAVLAIMPRDEKLTWEVLRS